MKTILLLSYDLISTLPEPTLLLTVCRPCADIITAVCRLEKKSIGFKTVGPFSFSLLAFDNGIA